MSDGRIRADPVDALMHDFIQPLKDTSKCHRCGGTGDLLTMENPGPVCLRCAGLNDLEFLPAGKLCSRAVPRRKVRDTPWSCASARVGAGMSGKVCW